MSSYIAEVVETFEYSPGGWRGLRVGIFKVENGAREQIGEYTRNYGTLFRTFCHFTKDGKDYALYSPHYTATRIMELPSCKDLGGEEPHSAGFCPVDYHVPSYVMKEYRSLDGKVSISPVNDPKEEDMEQSSNFRLVSPLLYYPFGFVAGCIWGDDSSYKIQYLDLSDAERGVIKRDGRFGYIELPDELTLKQAINMIDYGYDATEEYSYTALIAIRKRFDLRDGKIVE